jgi:hypothetical protein
MDDLDSFHFVEQAFRVVKDKANRMRPMREDALPGKHG